MCAYCKEGSMKQSYTTHVVDLKNCIVIVRNVPCEECERCGEKYFSDAVMEKLEEIVATAKEFSSEIMVVDYKGKVA